MRPREITAFVIGVANALRARFVYTPDDSQFGQPEHWSVMPWKEPGALHGDCDEFAMTAAAMLLAAGVPAEFIRVRYCLTETGGGHLVCGVVAGDTELIVDNRQTSVWPITDVDYQWKSLRQLDWPANEWRASK